MIRVIETNKSNQQTVAVSASSFKGVELEGQRIATLVGKMVHVRLAAGAVKALAVTPAKIRERTLVAATVHAMAEGRGRTISRVYDHDFAFVADQSPADYRKAMSLRRPAVV
jgi:hypothetical protein